MITFTWDEWFPQIHAGWYSLASDNTGSRSRHSWEKTDKGPHIENVY